MTIEGGRDAHSEHRAIVKTRRIALFLAAGFARVAIKELLLEGVLNRTSPVYSAFSMTDYSLSLGDRTYHAEIIDIPVRAAR